MLGKKTSLVVVLMLAIAAVGAILHLQDGATASTKAQLTLAEVKVELNALQSTPFRASAKSGGSRVLGTTRDGHRDGHDQPQARGTAAESPPPPLEHISGPLGANYTALEGIYSSGAWGNGYGAAADRLATQAGRSATRVMRLLGVASRDYAARAADAQTKVTNGSVAAIAVLLGAFALFFLRSVAAHTTAERLARENEGLLAASQVEALTDALTGLPNRRALVGDLTVLFAPNREASSPPHLLGLFDLDGFKQFNDTFGHPAGDALLVRLGHRLADAMAGRGTAYRIGGDEFCVLMPSGANDPFATARPGRQGALGGERQRRHRVLVRPRRRSRQRRSRWSRRCALSTTGCTTGRPAGRRRAGRARTCSCRSSASGEPTSTDI